MGKKPSSRNIEPGAGKLTISTSAPTVTVAPTLTVSDLAARLASIAPDTPNTTQRIRHWTREGVLPADESEHAGPGMHRRYADARAYSAAFLHVLTVAGLPISHSRFLKAAMPAVDAKAARWHAARKKGQATTLAPVVVGVTALGEVQVGERLKDPRDVVLKIEVDLAKLFAEVDRGRP